MGALLPGRLWHLPSVEHMSPIDTYTSQKGPAHTHRHDKHRRQVLRAKMSHPSICMTPKGSLREEGVTSQGRASRPGACVRGVVWATQVSSGGLRACRNMLVCVRVHVCACMPVYMHHECFCTRVCVFVPVCVCVRAYMCTCKHIRLSSKFRRFLGLAGSWRWHGIDRRCLGSSELRDSREWRDRGERDARVRRREQARLGSLQLCALQCGPHVTRCSQRSRAARQLGSHVKRPGF